MAGGPEATAQVARAAFGKAGALAIRIRDQLGISPAQLAQAATMGTAAA